MWLDKKKKCFQIILIVRSTICTERWMSRRKDRCTEVWMEEGRAERRERARERERGEKEGLHE